MSPEAKVNLRELISRSLLKAVEIPSDFTSQGKLHAERSRNFISQLDQEFCGHYQANDPANKVQVFTRMSLHDQGGFKRKELLYDITVCRYALKFSPGHVRELPYPTEILWQIESELKEHDTAPILEDFNKLLFGSAKYKLFIGADSFKHKDWLLDIAEQCMEIGCTKELYLALVPHPRVWDSRTPQIQVWNYVNRLWQEA